MANRPVGRVGTAAGIAFGRAVGVGRVHDDVARSLLPGPVRGLAGLGRRVAATGVGGLVADLALLGLPSHATLRMVAVDDLVTAALGRLPTAQVVVVGAGLDSRPWRLDALAGRTVFEVDRPGVQAAKRHAAAGLAEPGDLRWVAADLAVDDLGAALQAAGHEAERPTVWLWEAVLPYLPVEASHATLVAMADRSTSDSRLVLTWVRDGFRATPVHRATGAVVRAAFRLGREPLAGLLTRPELDVLLEGAGWVIGSEAPVGDWAAAVPGAHPRLDAFRVERVLAASRR